MWRQIEMPTSARQHTSAYHTSAYCNRWWWLWYDLPWIHRIGNHFYLSSPLWIAGTGRAKPALFACKCPPSTCTGMLDPSSAHGLLQPACTCRYDSRLIPDFYIPKIATRIIFRLYTWRGKDNIEGQGVGKDFFVNKHKGGTLVSMLQLRNHGKDNI